MDEQKVMQACVIVAIVLIVIAFICFFQGISAGVFLFVLALILGLIVIIMWRVQYSRYTWVKPRNQTYREEKSPSEALDDLKMRYVKGEITTEQFRQLKKELGK
jgi:uncharacterized membrane protein